MSTKNWYIQDNGDGDVFVYDSTTDIVVADDIEELLKITKSIARKLDDYIEAEYKND